MREFEELFNRYGLGPLATQFWVAARAGNRALAEQCLQKITAKLAQKGALRAAAGTLARMKDMVIAISKVAEVAPEVIKDGLILSEEMGLLGTAAAAEEAALPEELAAGPPGWVVAGVVILVLLVLFAVAAHAEENPPKLPKKNPFDELPPDMRHNPKFNPAVRLNKEVPKKMEEYKNRKHKKCTCYGGSVGSVGSVGLGGLGGLGGNIAGRHLAMGPTPPSRQLCTWPNCPGRAS